MSLRPFVRQTRPSNRKALDPLAPLTTAGHCLYKTSPPMDSRRAVGCQGWRGRTRTCDSFRVKETLYRLSYSPALAWGEFGAGDRTRTYDPFFNLVLGKCSTN